MLSKPKSGWSDFSLGKEVYGLSYLTNVPIEWLNQAIHGLETVQPFAVHGLLEPGRMICLVSYWNCHIIVEENEERCELTPKDVSYGIENVNMIDFCKMLYTDISTNIEEWCHWDWEKNVEVEDIKNKLERLEELIEKNSQLFRTNFIG